MFVLEFWVMIRERDKEMRVIIGKKKLLGAVRKEKISKRT